MNVRNSITLIGRLGRDPEIRKFDNGKQVARFPLATNDYYQTAEGMQKTTDWHDCTAWGKLAETLTNLLTKGQEVVIKGKLRYRDQPRSNGDKVRVAEVQVESFALVGSRKSTPAEKAA